jgi:hypothetical protein
MHLFGQKQTKKNISPNGPVSVSINRNHRNKLALMAQLCAINVEEYVLVLLAIIYN